MKQMHNDTKEAEPVGGCIAEKKRMCMGEEGVRPEREGLKPGWGGARAWRGGA